MSGDVLVVDDAADIRMLARVLLTRAGYDVREAATAEEALVLVAEEAPRVILLDLQLPGMDGWGLLSDLRERGCLNRTSVVLFSAHVNPGELRRAGAEGAAGYLTKPFSSEALLASVREATIFGGDA
jgi:CheY-like chemotaxis protein